MDQTFGRMKVVLFIAFITFSFLANGQFNVSIRVKDSVDRSPIPKPEIHIISPSDTSIVMGNNEGELNFSVKAATTYLLKVSSESFNSSQSVIRVKQKDKAIKIFLSPKNLMGTVNVIAKDTSNEVMTFLKPIEGFIIFNSKKAVVIGPDKLDIGPAANARTLFQSAPGLNIWESDGAGIQLGIGGRGLSPNRTANFNTRQNGYDMSADALGYPETYYTPPLEAVEKIQLIRGASSLQFGTQFGGLLNFILKSASDQPLAFRYKKSIGSFGLNTTFFSAGGTKKKWKYYAYFYKKTGNDFRPNSSFNVWNGHTNVSYALHPNHTLSFEYSHMQYLNQQAGGLTDLQFEKDHLQSNRERNWFNVNWNLASFSYNGVIGETGKLESKFFGLKASRKALGFLGDINRLDLNGNRDLIWGEFENFGNETRYLNHYKVKGNDWHYVLGFRAYKGYSTGMQGEADNGYGPNFYYITPEPSESSYQFPSTNFSVFGEHIVNLGQHFSITPGIRYEYIDTEANGRYTNRVYNGAGGIVFEEDRTETKNNERSFVLAGIGMSYKKSDSLEVYGNISQNYRSISFSDIQILNPNFRIDPNIQDEKGFNIDLGIRGQIKQLLTYDVSGFYLQYKDRIGILNQRDSVLYNIYQYRTNVADSRTLGVESFIQLNIAKLINRNANIDTYIFSNFAYTNAIYTNTENTAIQNKLVEHVPAITSKIGARIKWHKWSLSSQYSYTSEQFSDATNALKTPNAVNGVIPAYAVLDISGSYTFNGNLKLGFGVNNALNAKYFTRRSGGYPGPGIIPSTTRNLFISAELKF